MVDVSYIVSANSRPWDLNLCLLSLRQQTHQNFEVIVVDNTDNDEMSMHHVETLARCSFGQQTTYIRTRKENCYESSDVGAQLAKGKFLCFPSDDSYYCPFFADKMIEQEVLYGPWDFIYCNAMYTIRNPDDKVGYNGAYKYWILDAVCKHGHIDKTMFFAKREGFFGFRYKERPGWEGSDGFLAEEYVAKGMKIAKVHEPLLVHN